MKYGIYSKKKKQNRLKIIVLLFIVFCFFFFFRFVYEKSLVYAPDTRITISKGDGFGKFFAHVGSFEKLMIKFWIRNHQDQLPNLQQGTYILSGRYDKLALMKLIEQGPISDQQRVTLLEGWSIYDTDQYLTKQGIFQQGSYIQTVQDQSFIQQLRSEFSFLSMLPDEKSLEGFLYPDTYFLNRDNASVEQLIRAQLKNFNQKVWNNYREQFITFMPDDINLKNYNALILASVIENEEKSTLNKPIIAGIFINRLKMGMRLDADVTLCYGLKVPYDQCKDMIVKNLGDASNLYNTRQNYGLMPTPISSPSIQTLQSMFKYQQTNALFYLHDKQGKIYYADTLEKHNLNKQNYLN